MIKNAIKTSTFLSVTLEDGTVLFRADPTPEFYAEVMACKDDNHIIELFGIDVDNNLPKCSDELIAVAKGVEESKYLKIQGATCTIPSISELSVPQDFAEEILKAEREGNESLLQTYLNFWTLVSLNPNSNVRDNIFWFIRRWNIRITKSGLLVTYRNADFKKEGNFPKEFVELVTKDYLRIKEQKKGPKSFHYPLYDEENGDFENIYVEDLKLHKIEDKENFDGTTLAELYEMVTAPVDTTVFTDHHSHTFDIRIGTPVSMPRENTDQDSNVSCSRGLHVAATQWLQNNYFGDTGLVCLVNPANVVAIPVIDDYGKMRCCEYLPIAIAEWTEDGHIKECIDTHGFEDGYLIDYSGKVNNEDVDNYTLNYIRTVGIDRQAIADKIFAIAKENNNEQ